MCNSDFARFASTVKCNIFFISFFQHSALSHSRFFLFLFLIVVVFVRKSGDEETCVYERVKELTAKTTTNLSEGGGERNRTR